MMRRTQVSVLVVAATVLAGAGLIAQGKADVTGKWMLEVMTDVGGTTTPNVTLKQDGEKLTGHYSSETLGEADVTGTVKGPNVMFTFSADLQGQTIQVTYTGAVDGNMMKGKISLAGLAEGTFTGKRQ